MIGKIIAGSSFAGTVGYVMKKQSRIFDAKGVTLPDVREMMQDFKDQALLNPRIKNAVGHISLSFSPKDALRMTDALMLDIAKEYMQRMGITDTQYLLVRHLDQPYPHCHLVYNRVGNNGQTISDKNIKIRNAKVCRTFTEKYGLHFAQGKESVRREHLREPDKTKYEIYDTIKTSLPRSRSWEELEKHLKAQGKYALQVLQFHQTKTRSVVQQGRFRVFWLEDRPAIQLLQAEPALCTSSTTNPLSDYPCKRIPCGHRQLSFGTHRHIRRYGWRRK